MSADVSISWPKWSPDKVREMVLAQVGENMEVACKWAEGDARRRLLSIQDPKKGAKYRAGVVARRLTYVVRREGKTLVGYIGISKGTRPVKGAQHIGMWIELGSRTAPAQPYLRPAVFNNARTIVRLVAGL